MRHQEVNNSGNVLSITKALAMLGYGDAADADPLPAATYTLAGVPYTTPTMNEGSDLGTLSATQWPSDYCADFDLTLPAANNGNPSGYGGTVVMMGQVDITVTHTSKLLPSATGDAAAADQCGLMTIEQSNGDGPYYATPALGAFGTRHKASFCYKQSTGTPSWIVDGAKIAADFLHNP